MILILFFAHKASPPHTHDLSDTPSSMAKRRWHASAFAVPERHISDSGKSRDANGFRKIMAARCIGPFAAHCTSHRSTVHRATQRTAFDTRPAKHARRHIFHQETCPAAPYTRKYSRTAFAPPAHTHENASKDTYPACLYIERALPSHIQLAYSPRPNHSSISCK